MRRHVQAPSVSDISVIYVCQYGLLITNLSTLPLSIASNHYNTLVFGIVIRLDYTAVSYNISLMSSTVQALCPL